MRIRIISVRILHALSAATCLASCGSLQQNLLRSSESLPQTSDPMSSARGIAFHLVRSTAVAALRQPVTTTKVGFALFYQRSSEIIRSNLAPPDFTAIQPREAPGTPGFERLLDCNSIRPEESGTLSFRVDGDAFFTDFENEVRRAKKSINLQIFIFDNDDIAVQCADLLRSRASQVPTRVLMDDLGTTFSHTSAPTTRAPKGFVPPGDIAEYLRNASRVEVRRSLTPWLVSDHSKLIVFDHERAYLGGMNIGREYRSEWHDLMVRVEGPIVHSLEREFARAWRKAGPWGDFALIRKPLRPTSPEPGKGISLRILRTDPSEGRYDVLNASKLAIQASRKRIWIENPYFASDDFINALIVAAHRGVDVRVILPASGDSPIMDAGNLATARKLIENRVKVFRFPKMTHMKVMICDGWATLGSANLDTLSMRINRELNLSFNDPAAIKALEKAVFIPDFMRSHRMAPEETDDLLGPVVESIADQL